MHWPTGRDHTTIECQTGMFKAMNRWLMICHTNGTTWHAILVTQLGPFATNSLRPVFDLGLLVMVLDKLVILRAPNNP